MADTHIKIHNVVPKIQYIGNGVTTQFNYSFEIFDNTNMKVYLEDELQGSGYTVYGAGETGGGYVEFDTAPDVGVKVTLIRQVPIERITDFQEGGTFRPKNLNDDFDRQTAFCQQVSEELSRSVRVPPTSPVDPEEVAEKVVRIYDSIDNIDTVTEHVDNIDTTAENIEAVKTAVENIEDIKTSAENILNINSVADNETNINTVATNISNVNTVGGNISNVNSVAGNTSNINTVAGNETNITIVAEDINDVKTTAENIENVNNVGGGISNINTVAGGLENINAVAGDLENINAVAGDLENIDAASGYAADAKKWAVGLPTEPAEHSAKWWAEHSGLNQAGDYDPSVSYSTRDFVRSISGQTSSFYISLVDNNIGNPLTDTTKWSEWFSVTGAGSLAGLSDVGILNPANGQFLSFNGSVWENTTPQTTLSSLSTDAQIPSAKCVYDIIGNVESLLAAI